MKAMCKPRIGRPADPRRLAFPAALERAGGNQTHAARALGVTPPTACRWAKALREGTLLDPFQDGAK